MISKSCQYAMRAVVYIASTTDKKHKVKDIAKEIDAPEAFTAKLLQTLSRDKIITSLKGPYGGFYIDTQQLDAPIIQIVYAIDGRGLFHTCGLGLKQCSDKYPCPFHTEYRAVREKTLNTFNALTIRKLANNLEKRIAYLRDK